MTLFVYTTLLLIGYGVLFILCLLGLFILYSAIDEIFLYLFDKPRKKNF